MNTTLIKKIMLKVQNLESQIEEIERTIFEISANGYASATISSSGGSKSYSRLDLPKLESLLNHLKNEKRQYQTFLSNGGNSMLGGKIIHVYF